ncbi:hypothetical protein [Dolichospermum sp. LEGE 00240]|nr:hypothetical protein [Dolichospermum sp. LEGE 00240]
MEFITSEAGNGQLLVVSCQLSVVSCQLSVVSCQWLLGRRKKEE